MTRTLLLTAHDERSDRDALGLAVDLAGPLDARIVVGGVVVPGGEDDHKAREDLAGELDTLEASIPDGVESEIRSVDAVSLVAGALGAMILSPDSLTAGASGAIYGLLGALIVLHRARGIPLRDTGLITILVLNMVLSFGISGISIGGHLGGLVGGGIAGYVLYDLGARRDLPKALPWVLSAVLFVGCFVGTILVADSAAHF